jgi:hypothetical protein
MGGSQQIQIVDDPVTARERYWIDRCYLKMKDAQDRVFAQPRQRFMLRTLGPPTGFAMKTTAPEEAMATLAHAIGDLEISS